VTNEYKLDPEGRVRETTTGTTKTISHYDGSGEAVAWTESPEKWVRNIYGLEGALLGTQTNGATPVLQLHDLQGDVVATIGDKEGETKLLSTYNSTEFGVPTGGKAPPKLAYLGALGIESSLSSGVITYGATSYVPQTGQALQSEQVQAPGWGGGSGRGAAYAMQQEPWIMQGALRAGAESVALEAARERAAAEAADGAATSGGGSSGSIGGSGFSYLGGYSGNGATASSVRPSCEVRWKMTEASGYMFLSGGFLCSAHVADFEVKLCMHWKYPDKPWSGGLCAGSDGDIVYHDTKGEEMMMVVPCITGIIYTGTILGHEWSENNPGVWIKSTSPPLSSGNYPRMACNGEDAGSVQEEIEAL
jgi:hypothetical protein